MSTEKSLDSRSPSIYQERTLFSSGKMGDRTIKQEVHVGGANMKCETSHPNRNSMQMIVEQVDADPIKQSVFTPTDDTSTRQGLMATNFTSGRNSISKYMRTAEA